MKQRKLSAKNIVGAICFVTLFFSVGFSFIKWLNAPATPTQAKPQERLKSDYILMLLQCLLGLIVLFVPTAIQKLFKITLPNYMSILYFLFLYCAIFLGEVCNFFFVVPHWDLILHTFSSAMLSILGFSLVSMVSDTKRGKLTLNPLLISLFVFCFSLTVGCIWEIYEFVMDGIFGMNMQKFMLEDGTQLIGRMAVADTMEDMIIDALSALIVCVVGYFTLKRKIPDKKNMIKEEAEYHMPDIAA